MKTAPEALSPIPVLQGAQDLLAQESDDTVGLERFHNVFYGRLFFCFFFEHLQILFKSFSNPFKTSIRQKLTEFEANRFSILFNSWPRGP